MSCQRCGTDRTNLDLCASCRESIELREQITVARAERDEAREQLRTSEDLLKRLQGEFDKQRRELEHLREYRDVVEGALA